MSALVIAAHVKEGLELADQYKLPPVIKDGIVEHHGTTLIRFFYQRQLDLGIEGDGNQGPAFRYSGPRPQSRETSILMLADSIEAAAKSLDTHEPQQLQALVERLIREKISDGQLDDSP